MLKFFPVKCYEYNLIKMSETEDTEIIDGVQVLIDALKVQEVEYIFGVIMNFLINIECLFK